MASNGEGEVVWNDSSPTFHQVEVWIFVEGVVYFDKVENLRICFQRGFAGNVKISPTARADKIVGRETGHAPI
jgi:hypothetical protein